MLCINVREYRRLNNEWTIQRHRQHWVHKTQDADKQKKNNITQKPKMMSNMELTKQNEGEPCACKE